ncbi:MAG: hypothetical protein AAF694_00185 [Bacteroidota bacterium]
MFDISSLTDNPTNSIIAIAVVIALVYIFFRVAKSAIKLILTVIVLGLAFYFWQGGTVDGLKDKGTQALFKDADLSNMMQIHCQDEKADKVKCTCVIGPVFQDIHSRLSTSEISQANQDPERIEEEIQTSMRNKRKEIRKCLVNNSGGKVLDQLKGVLGGLSSTE